MIFEKPTAKLPIVFTAQPTKRYCCIESRADQIAPVDITDLEFESEIYASTELARKQPIERIFAPDMGTQ